MAHVTLLSGRHNPFKRFHLGRKIGIHNPHRALECEVIGDERIHRRVVIDNRLNLTDLKSSLRNGLLQFGTCKETEMGSV